jgi:4-amino-4-deoxy-L-arabinose transferase-like glycosyltransferase
LFLLASFLTRLPALPRAVLDWDESLYFLMARAWLRHGALPYTAIWDNKPIGIYVIFAAAQAVCGGGIISIRLATVLVVALLAWTVAAITESLTANRAAGIFGGFTFIIASLTNDGLAANTELFMAAFTARAMLAALQRRPAALIGLLIGCACMVKYVAVFEAPVIFLYVVWQERRLSPGLLLLAGAALPLAFVIALYGAYGQLPVWYADSIAANFRRVAAPLTEAALLSAVQTQAVRWGTLLALGLATICTARRRPLLAAWLLAGLAGAAAAKSFYDHYFLQILPALAVIAGSWFARVPARDRLAFVLVIWFLPASAGAAALADAMHPDVPRQIAAALKDAGAKSLYVFDSEPILYALTDTAPPTRYVLPSVLTGKLLPAVAGVDAPAELGRILATCPAYIVRRTDPARDTPQTRAILNHNLQKNYVLWRHFYGTDVYRRINAP